MIQDRFLENLDCLSIDPDDLDAYAKMMLDEGMRAVKTRHDAENTALLIVYAMLRARNMRARLAGSGADASRTENASNAVYEAISARYQW